MTEPYKPILRPDQLVSPRISTRDRIILGKRGVCFNGLAWHERFLRMLSEKNCFWGRCPGCNPPSVLSSICLIGEPAPPAEDHRRLLPLSHRCRDPFHPQLPIFHRRSPGEGMSSSSRPGKVSFLRPRTGSHLAPLTITTVSAMWVEFPQDHHQWPCNCSPARRLSQQGSEKMLCRKAS